MTARSPQLGSAFDLLRGSDPVDSAVLRNSGIEDALDLLVEDVMRLPHSARQPLRRLPRKTALAAAIIVVVIAAGVATAAVALHAHTGIFASGPNASVGGPGEELNLAAPDFKSAALKLSADIPYPSGYASWRDWVLTEQAPGPGGASADDQVTTGAIRGWFAASAFCAWVKDWRQATIAGDQAEAAQAAASVSAAPSWSAVTAEDPNPSPSTPNDPSAEPGTLFGWMLPYRTAVLGGDRATVDQLLASGYGDGRCWLSDPQWMSALRANPSWSKLSPGALAQRYQQFLSQERP